MQRKITKALLEKHFGQNASTSQKKGHTASKSGISSFMKGKYLTRLGGGEGQFLFLFLMT